MANTQTRLDFLSVRGDDGDIISAEEDNAKDDHIALTGRHEPVIKSAYVKINLKLARSSYEGYSS